MQWMFTEDGYCVPQWAPRVSKSLIARMYSGCAEGVLDAEAIDEVGFSLYARCESMLEVISVLRTGRPICPVCESRLPPRTWEPSEELVCAFCGWSCPSAIYNKTHARKNLGTGGLDDRIREFMDRFERAKDPRERLVLVDTLIHLFHWASDQGRPMAAMLIEGRMKRTAEFLDRLSYGDAVPAEVLRTRRRWRRMWERNGWSRGRGQ